MATDLSSPVASKEQVMPTPAESARKVIAFSKAEGRLVSLDTFRGFIMFWIIGGDAFAHALRALKPNFLFNALAYEMSHTPWQGLRFYDCIWPSFMLMVGISIPFSFAKRSRTETYPQILVHALTRFVVLFLLGSLRESISRGHPYWIELSSALQPIAVAYLAAMLLVRKSQKVQAAVGALILFVYALILAFVPGPGVPAGSYLPGVNLVRAIDIMLLGRTFPVTDAWGTILCTLPTISTTILGLLIGEWLMSSRSSQSKAKMIAGVGLLCLAVGYALSPIVPIIMKIWTTSYGLTSAGWACLMFAFFYWLVDLRGRREWTLPLVVIGSNAVFIYMLSSIVPLPEWVSIFTRGMAANVAPLANAAVVLLVEWLILFWMYRNRILIKA